MGSREGFPTLRTIRLRRNYRSGQAIVRGALQAIAPTSLIAQVLVGTPLRGVRGRLGEPSLPCTPDNTVLDPGRVLEALSRDATPITIHEAVSDKAEAEFIVHTIENLIGGTTFHALDTGRTADGTGGNFSFADFAVLSRTDALADALAEALARAGFPFERRSHAPLIEQPSVQSLLAAMRELPADLSIPERLQTAAARRRLHRRSAWIVGIRRSPPQI